MEPTEEHNPWHTAADRVVYDNPWIRVHEHQVVRPDGRAGIYGFVEPKNVALGVVPVFDDGDTVLVGQWRYTLDDYSWEVPEGGGDPHVDLLAEARRELREETGLDAARWIELGPVHTSNTITSEWGFIWLAEGLTQGTPDPDGTERLRRWRLPLEEAHAMALDGRLTDSITVIGLCRAAAVLGRRP